MDIGKQQRVIVVTPLEEPTDRETPIERPQPAVTVVASPTAASQERETEPAPA